MDLRIAAVALVAALGVGLVPQAAGADSASRFELDFGFLAGERSYDEVPFSYAEGDASPALMPPAFRGVSVAGPSVSTRAIVRGVRLGFGWERAYHRGYDGQPGAAHASAAPSTRALTATAYHFALGYELALGRVTPFVDLVGTAESASVDLVAGDAQSTYDTALFGYSLRAGARVHFSRHWFIHASAELGAQSPIDWSTHAGVGVAVY